ncbi:helix-turn-helix transcriptional regulator [Candidatus Nomurabacteria bacterium]|nr:helix-turn-helix transcriptional regulator [Candidatus Kaiserbacteria bacterium]MCB9810393.1 helix-turn-helix transcriptional regulator [Candidatus Nomurabacteria bacterium]MCB9818024.1 helix-turn-helix transcriptional regulator [Candidatus Nomurabacteria bacterium]
MKNSSQQIGGIIKKRRLDAGMSMDKLAQEAGVSKAYISQLESGTSTKPSASKLFDIAAALGTSMADLLGKTVPITDMTSEVEIPGNLVAISKTLSISDSMLKRMVMVQNRQGDSLNEVSVEKWANLFFAMKQIDEAESQ